MHVYDHALRITNRLAATVAELEVRCGEAFARATPSSEQLTATIQNAWPHLVADAQESAVSTRVDYLAGLYNRLSKEAGIKDAGSFTDRSDFPWNEFYSAGCGDESRCEDAWVIAELYWGGYVQHLHLTLGWLLMDAIRIQQNLTAITAMPGTIDRFIDYLRWAGPEMFDGESLRGLFYEHERQAS